MRSPDRRHDVLVLANDSAFQYAYTVDANARDSQVDVTDRRGKVRRVQFNERDYVVKNTFPLGDVNEQVRYRLADFRHQAGIIGPAG